MEYDVRWCSLSMMMVGVVMYMEGWARAQRCCIVTAATLG